MPYPRLGPAGAPKKKPKTAIRPKKIVDTITPTGTMPDKGNGKAAA